MSAGVSTTEVTPPVPPKAVLVIEPNEEHQVLSTVALGRNGYRVTVAGTAREGLRLAFSRLFDAIVLDAKVKDALPLEVLATLANRLPLIPKIFVVSGGHEAVAAHALEVGASGYLVKTARYQELLPAEVEQQIARALTSRRLTEEERALGESEDRFRKAFRTSPVAIAITRETDGRVVDANDRFLQVMGFEREEVVGRSLRDVDVWTRPEDRDAFAAMIRTQGRLVDQEFHFKTKAGAARIGSISLEHVEIDGEPCLLAMLRDITDEHRMERVRNALYEITEATALGQPLPELCKAIHDAVEGLMPAKNLYIALLNPATGDLEFPYFKDERDPTPAPEKPGRGLTEYVLRTGEALLATPEVFQDLIARGEVVLAGAPSVDWLGAPLTVRDEVAGVLAVQSYDPGVRYTADDRDLLNFVSAQVAMAIDRRRSEDARRRAEQRFRTMYEDAPVGIVLTDLEGRIVDANPSFQRFLGRAHTELRGLHITEYTHPDDILETRRLFGDLARGNRDRYQFVKRVLRPDGQVLWGRFSVSLLRSDPPEPMYVIGMVEDITQERIAEDAVRVADHRYRALVENVTDAVLLVDPTGACRFASPASEKVLGVAPPDLVGRDVFSIMEPEDAARLRRRLEELLSRPRGITITDFRYRAGDGGVRWVEAVATNLLADPDIEAIVVNLRDTTERQRASEEIRFHAELLDHVRNGVIATGPELRVTYWNEYATRLLGWTDREVAGRDAFELLDPEVASGFGQSALERLRAGEVWEGRVRVRHKDGTRIPVQIVVNPFRDLAGTVVGFVGVVADLTDITRYEAVLEARAGQQAAVADLGVRALMGLAPEVILREAAALVTKTLGVDHASILAISGDGRTLVLEESLGWKAGLGRVENSAEDSQAGFTLRDGGPTVSEDYEKETRFLIPELFRSEGLRCGISVVIPGPGRPYGVLYVGSTSRRDFSADDVAFCQAMATLIGNAVARERSERLLADAERLASLGQLAAYVGHEINTPLTNIGLLASSAARLSPEGGVREKLGKLQEERRRAARIIAELADYPSKRTLAKAPNDLRRIATAAADAARPHARPEVGVIVESSGDSVLAVVDGPLLQDALFNVLRHALAATERGSVTVSLEEWPDLDFIYVTDTSPGMSREAAEALFRPSRGSRSSAEGLLASRAIVAAHGGKIEVSSEPGKGAVYTIVLPKAQVH